MPWHNSNHPWRLPEPRRSSSRPNSQDAPVGIRSARQLTNMAHANASVAPLPRRIAVARERQLASNRDRINSLLGDSPYTTRRWTPTPAEFADRLRSRLSLSSGSPTTTTTTTNTTTTNADSPSIPLPISIPSPPMAAVTVTPPLGDFPSQSPYPTNRMTSLEQLDRTLDEANAHLRALLDMTQANTVAPRQLLHPSHPSGHTSPSRPHDFGYENHRNKRRKVDLEKQADGFRTFRYGHYGQVEAGDLEMEMVSCDGGMFSNELSYAAENILKNDNSVYCTKGNRCNIILRHRGSTTFTLSELVIKAPGSMNYSHPVRQGMIFVTMEQDNMLNRTAQYQIQYAPSSRDRVTFNTDTRSRFSHEPQQTISISHNPDGSSTTRTTHSYIYSSTDSQVRMPMMPREFTSSQPDFNIVTECSEEEEDGTGGFSVPPISILRRTPYRIGPLPFENDNDDDDDDDEDEDDDDDDDDDDDENGFGNGINVNVFGSEDNISQHGHATARNLSNTTTTNLLDVNFDLTPGLSGSDTGVGAGGGSGSHDSSLLAEARDTETSRPVGGRLLSPHARFHIEKKKSKCTVRFDPPVSGRFILLKMWSSHHDLGSNIDIQSVIARGFAGPRYFPSVEMR